MAPVTALVVGAGQRGHHVYGAWALRHPDRLRCVAVVDPDPARRRRFGEAHGIALGRRHASVEEAVAAGDDADAWIITGPDRSHHAAALAGIEAARHVLVEKPIAVDPAGAASLAAAARSAGDAVVGAALVLRATPFFGRVHDVLCSGVLGDLVAIEHGEHVAAWHMAHSFVRGAWSRVAAATPFIVQKCCHDLDLIAWNLGDDLVRTIASVGSHRVFRPESAPPGATGRCSDGCPVDGCPYDARAIYLDPRTAGWPVHVISDDLSAEGRLTALREGPYGVCAYRAGSDTADRQLVAMETMRGTVVTLIAHGHSHREQRTIAYRGTAGTLTGTFDAAPTLALVDHRTGSRAQVDIPSALEGHGGGDEGTLLAFLDAIGGRGPAPPGPADVLEGHLLAFAAEASREQLAIIDMGRFRRSAAGSP